MIHDPRRIPPDDGGDDDGDPGRGLVLGLLLAAPFWAAVALLLWAWLRGAWPWGGA